jgi:hypothetical protein
MYILRVRTRGAALNGDLHFAFDARDGCTRKWTLLPDDESSLELLRLVSLACGGVRWLERLPFSFAQLVAGSAPEAVVAAQLELHVPRDISMPAPSTVIGAVVSVSSEGSLANVKATGLLARDVPVRRPFGRGNRRLLFLAYGPDFDRIRGTTDFDFSDPWFRLQRFKSLFEKNSCLTSVPAFLGKLLYRVRKGRLPAKLSFAQLCAVLQTRLGIPTGTWDVPGADLLRLWESLGQEQQELLIPIIDAIRHTIDASPRDAEPLHRPGVLLFHRLDSLCPPELVPAYATAVDELFPNMQLVCSLSSTAMDCFPDALRQAQLPVAPAAKATRAGKVGKCSKAQRTSSRSRPKLRTHDGRSVLLIQVDGRMPNLALMKLATHFIRAGKAVTLARPNNWKQWRGQDEVYASCVFDCNASKTRVLAMRKYYGEHIHVGGSGVSLAERLPSEIESLSAYYDLYPELEGCALGFLTRGCPAKCAFCIVPIKEGRVRQVSELDDLLGGDQRRKLILLDDNILAFKGADILLEEMASRGIAVNFNQTLDIMRVTEARAKLLRRIKSMNVRFTRSAYYFSLNSCDNLNKVREKYDLFGFDRHDNVEFVCMYGYDTTLAEDLERFRFLRSLPGAYVFVQEYRPIRSTHGRQIRPHPVKLFDDLADEHINELIRVLFPQNMKSMEKYYRWLGERYYERFGRLNMPLTQTLFRYNNRESYGSYLAKHPPRSWSMSP